MRAPARARPARAAVAGRGRCVVMPRCGGPARGPRRPGAARSMAVCSTSASSTAVQAKPSAAARSPSMRSPNSAIAAAASRAPVRPRSAPWPPPGCSPIGMKPEMILASRATMRTSVASIRLSPAPTAPPRTAATVGASSSPTRANERYTLPRPAYTSGSAGSRPAASSVPRSPPAQKKPPSPLTTTAPTASSASSSSHAATSSSAMATVSALRRSGASKLSTATPPSRLSIEISAISRSSPGCSGERSRARCRSARGRPPHRAP